MNLVTEHVITSTPPLLPNCCHPTAAPYPLCSLLLPQFVYKPATWVAEPMKEQKYELKLESTASGGLLLVKSMATRVVSSECVETQGKRTHTYSAPTGLMCDWHPLLAKVEAERGEGGTHAAVPLFCC
jgi:hypothetical protein